MFIRQWTLHNVPEWIRGSGCDRVHGDCYIIDIIMLAGNLESHLDREVTAGGKGNHGKEPLQQPEEPSWLLQRLHVECHPD